MRVAMTLAVTNVVVWGGFIAFAPGTHFAWPGSYKFWWFDDVPWAFLTAAMITFVILAIFRSRRENGPKNGIAIR